MYWAFQDKLHAYRFAMQCLSLRTHEQVCYTMFYCNNWHIGVLCNPLVQYVHRSAIQCFKTYRRLYSWSVWHVWEDVCAQHNIEFFFNSLKSVCLFSLTLGPFICVSVSQINPAALSTALCDLREYIGLRMSWSERCGLFQPLLFLMVSVVTLFLLFFFLCSLLNCHCV